MRLGLERASVEIARYREDPVAFCKDVLGWSPWSRQKQILESVRDHARTAVASCHGPGKTAAAARACLWYLACYPGSRVVTTAPTNAQLRDVLWREIALGHRESKGFIGGELFNARLEIAGDWFMTASSPDRPERFQGHHSERLFLCVDEAAGVPEEIYEAAQGFLTSPNSRVLLVGNPTTQAGQFFNCFHSERGLWNTIRISAFDCPAFSKERVPRKVSRALVSRKWVEDMTKKWGEGSPLWQVRINAQFPSQSDDAVVSLGDVEAAQRRTLEPGEPVVLACDVARFGSDETVLAVRRGNHIRIKKSYSGRDTMKTVGEISRLARDLEREHGRKPLIVIDDTGVGGGVTDRLKELSEFRTVPFIAAGKASHPRDYRNRRDQAWFEFAESLPELDLDPDEDLAADLLAPKYSLDSAGKRVVEAKAETKRRLRRSPDRADAVVMAFAVGRGGRRGGRLYDPSSIRLPEPGGIPGFGASEIARARRFARVGREPTSEEREAAARAGLSFWDVADDLARPW